MHTCRLVSLLVLFTCLRVYAVPASRAELETAPPSPNTSSSALRNWNFCPVVNATRSTQRRTAARKLSQLCASRPQNLQVPVLFVHRVGVVSAPSRYFEAAVSTALEFNSRVLVLLSGKGDVRLDPRVELTAIDFDNEAEPLLKRAKQFATVYKHMSGNGYDYELISFQRFFIILEIMRRHNLPAIMYLDSDVLFFRNATEEATCMKNCDVSICEGNGASSAHSSFWTRTGLELFCDYLMEQYTDPAELDVVQKQWESYKRRFNNTRVSGGICDMTFVQWFKQKQQKQTKPGAVVCNNCGGSDAGGLYDSKHAFKLPNFALDDVGMPYVTLGRQTVHFKTMHFQGTTKHFLRKCGTSATL